MTEELADGPVVEPFSYWSGSHYHDVMCRSVIYINDTLYAEFEDGSCWDHNHDQPMRILVPVKTLLRDWTRDDYEYPPLIETVQCKECGSEGCGTANDLERRGWWLGGMGSGPPLCPEHANSDKGS